MVLWEDREMPKRIQRKRTKGWRMPSNTICVDRSTRWGNPFKAGVHYDHQHAVDLFHTFFHAAANCTISDRQIERLRNEGADVQQFICAALQVGELHGKNLACWCDLDQPCHADTLLMMANAVTLPPSHSETP